MSFSSTVHSDDARPPRNALPVARAAVLVSLGLVLFFSPIKFGNPIESLSGEFPPRGAIEWFFMGWLPTIGWIAIFFVSAWVLGVSSLKFEFSKRPWTFWLPLVWLISQWLALPFSIYFRVSVDTVMLFSAAVLSYYLAALAVRDERDLRVLLACLGSALVVVCVTGFQQRFGGLTQTAEWAAQYHPELLTPDLLRKLHDPRGTRIFATFVYPPSLAGFLVLALGPSCVAIWLWQEKFTQPVRWILGIILTATTIACLVWSRSKGGLLALTLSALTTLSFLPLPGRRRVAVGLAAIAIAVIVFVFGYGIQDLHFAFSTGRQRLAYWQAGAKIFANHPWAGTGPGTFGSIHALYKSFAAEYARLEHNNFLQMATDSGLPGFLSFAVLWIVGLAHALRRLSAKTDWRVTTGLGLGLVAWMWHNAMDFDLYIPGLAFPAFILLGAIEGVTLSHRETQPSPSTVWARGGRWALGLVCLLPIWPMVNRTQAAYEFEQARNYLGNNPPNLYGAMGAMERATKKLVPGDAVFLDFLGQLQSNTGQLDSAIESTKRATELDPFRATYHWHLGHLYGKKEGGLGPQTLLELEKAKHCHPTNPEYQHFPTRFP